MKPEVVEHAKCIIPSNNQDFVLALYNQNKTNKSVMERFANMNEFGIALTAVLIVVSVLFLFS